MKKDLVLVIEEGKDVSDILKKLKVDRYEVALVVKDNKTPEQLEEEIKSIEPKYTIDLVKNNYQVDYAEEQIVDGIFGYTTIGQLHHHDEHSIRDGLGNLNSLLDMLEEKRIAFCSITNHGSIGGWIEQYFTCRERNIKPILGCEFYLTYDKPEFEKKTRKAYHLLALAKTLEGYKNIIALHNDAQINNFYYNPRTNPEALKRHSKGLIVTTACFSGEIPTLLREGNRDRAKELYRFYNTLFDDFYIELTMVEMPEVIEQNLLNIEFAKEVGAKLIVVADSHYLLPEDVETHDIWLLLRDHKTLEEKNKGEKVWQFSCKDAYYKLYDDMKSTWEKLYENTIFTQEVFNEAVSNVRNICLSIENYDIPTQVCLPKFSDDSGDILTDKARKGMDRLGLAGKEDYEERLKLELDMIINMGFADYFLIVEDILDYAKSIDCFLGFGRGSIGGSLVAYCLDIMGLDPIKYGMLFERFLDESRSDPPDIDLDFDPSYRAQIKQYVIDKYGEGCVCNIGTIQKTKIKSALLDVSRVYSIPAYVSIAVTKSLPDEVEWDKYEKEKEKYEEYRKKIMNGDDAKEPFSTYTPLVKFYKEYPDIERHVNKIMGQVRTVGKHAAGVIISDRPLWNEIGMRLDKEGQRISVWGESGTVEDLSRIGKVKFDFLGLTNLSVISMALKLINENHGLNLSRKDIDLEDSESIKTVLEDGTGIFQLDSKATAPILKACNVNCLADIAAVNSLLRPGPKDAGMHLEYGNRKHGRSKYEIPDIIKPVLEETYGTIIFQEQCLSGDMMILTPQGEIRIDELVKNKNAKEVFCVNNDGDLVVREIEEYYQNGKKEVFTLTFDDGKTVTCTESHKLLTSNRGWVRAKDLLEYDDVITF